jgi:hypothetical protein
MPINLRVSGDFTPYLKYNSKAGRWYARFDGVNSDVEIANPRIAIDLENIKTGWIAFSQTGGPPQILWDPSQAEESPKPNWEGVKRGFRVVVVGRDAVTTAGAVLGEREVMATANAIIKPIIDMYNQWEKDRGDHPGCIPVYRCTGVVALNGRNGVNYEPVFKLLSWIARDKMPELASQETLHDVAFNDVDEPEGMTVQDDGDDIPF